MKISDESSGRCDGSSNKETTKITLKKNSFTIWPLTFGEAFTLCSVLIFIVVAVGMVFSGNASGAAISFLLVTLFSILHQLFKIERAVTLILRKDSNVQIEDNYE